MFGPLSARTRLRAWEKARTASSYCPLSYSFNATSYCAWHLSCGHVAPITVQTTVNPHRLLKICQAQHHSAVLSRAHTRSSTNNRVHLRSTRPHTATHAPDSTRRTRGAQSVVRLFDDAQLPQPCPTRQESARGGARPRMPVSLPLARRCVWRLSSLYGRTPLSMQSYRPARLPLQA